ncbi:urate hydroxylase PuuD [Myxococcota bacterium]|nr:urate hydroxylase PuuD [Myxococcota bacterium]
MEILTANGIEVLLRWLHVLAGITWIGVLYYLNFIQTPFFGTELGGTAKSAMTRGLVPNALWWFRWGAMFTFLSGWTIVFYRLFHLGIPASDGYMTKILTGGLMGTLMWFNVWFLIWPAQQVVIANALQVAGGGQPIPEAAARAGKAAMYSRTNVVFSIPMVFFMVAAANLPGFLSGTNDMTYWIAAFVVLGLVEANALIGPGKPSQKPLTTVSGAIHMGLGLWLVLLVLGSVLNS